MSVLGKPAMQAILFTVFALLSGICFDLDWDHTGFAFFACALLAVCALFLNYLDGGFCTSKKDNYIGRPG